jgi:excisionase family DNA binding protein
VTAAEPLRTPDEVAARLVVNRRTAQRLMSSGAIRTTRVGVQLRTTDQWVDEYLKRNTSGGRGRHVARVAAGAR